MPEWLIERGIGETRCALVADGEIVEARILLDGIERAGTVRSAKLKSAGVPAIALDGEQEYLLPKGAPGANEGATISIEVTRERIPGAEPWKRPLARFAEESSVRSIAQLAHSELLPFPAPEDRLGNGGWNDLIDQARSGLVPFAGGELRISPTAAMTLIDVDGSLPAEELAMRGAAQAADAIRRLDIGGSIGIDLPTVANKAARQAAATAIDERLPSPFERTAVNGFGFVQIVRPRLRASLIEQAQDRGLFEARALLRRAAFGQPGPKTLAAHPAVIAALEANPGWIDALARQIGGPVRLRIEPKLPISAGHVANC